MTDDDRPGLHIVSDVTETANPPGDAASDDLDGANDEALRIKLSKLEDEHRDLDMAIQSLEERMPYDRLAIQRMKKRKLSLKDDIIRLHAQILPDIIA